MVLSQAPIRCRGRSKAACSTPTSNNAKHHLLDCAAELFIDCETRQPEEYLGCLMRENRYSTFLSGTKS